MKLLVTENCCKTKRYAEVFLMGCCCSSNSSSSTCRCEAPVPTDYTVDFTGLTEHERNLVRTSMKAVSDPRDIKAHGGDFFMKVTMKYPDYCTLFPLLKKLSSSQVHLSPAVRYHGLLVFKKLSECMANLHDPVKVNNMFSHLAENHFKRGVLQTHFETIPDIFKEYLAEELVPRGMWSLETEKAWDKLWTFILGIIVERQHELANPNPDPATARQSTTSAIMKLF